MCKHEIIGDFYRGCGHFHGRYFTGETSDCYSEECRTSSRHKHKSASNCRCPEIFDEDRKVQNMFQKHFAECQRVTR